MNQDKARQILIDYLVVKVLEADWHGVADAANDLRVLEAREEPRRDFISSAVERELTSMRARDPLKGKDLL